MSFFPFPKFFSGSTTDGAHSSSFTGAPIHCPALDDVRGIAALWVVLYHAYTAGHISNLTTALPTPIRIILFDWGYLGVPIFFVLSGFVIAHSLFSRPLSWAGFQRFMVRRFLRLSPAYWTSIAIVMLLGLAESLVRGEALALPSVVSVGAHLLFLQDLLHQPELSPVYWTLAIEMQFYALFYSLLMLNEMSRSNRATGHIVRSSQGDLLFLAVAGILALCSLAAAPMLFSWGRTVFPYWYCFLMGILTHWSLCRRIHYGWLLALLISCGLLVAPQPVLVPTYLASCGLTATLLGLAASGRLMRTSGWVLQQLGNLSYSVYLLHGAVFGPFFFLRQRLLTGVLGPSSQSNLAVGIDLLSLGGAIAITYTAAALLYRWVEQPSLQWNRRLKMQRR